MPRPPKIRMCIDKCLPQQHHAKAAAAAVAENPDNRPPMGIAPAGTMSMALITGKKWQPGRTLTVAFLDGTAAKQSLVKRVVPEWAKYANVSFAFVSGRSGDIRISFAQEGAWSYIGTDALGIPRNQPTMNFGFIDEATILHEFGHALGCIHEHQHPEAGIPWNRERVYQSFGGPPNNWSRQQVDVNLFQRYDRTITQFSGYDKASIMHYPVDKQLTDGVFEVGWNGALSQVDKEYIATAYPGRVGPASPDVLIRSAGSFTVVDYQGKMAIVLG